MAKESVVGIFEKIIMPFHNMSIVITAVSALSIHTFITQLFEPLTRLYYSLLLTFPLTVGLIVVFLILYNTNWQKVSFIHIVLAPMPIALLFMLLTSISDNYGLEKRGLDKHEEEEKATGEQKEKKDSVAFINPAKPSSGTATFNPENLQKVVKQFEDADSAARYRVAHPAWYEKTQITKNIAWAIVFLKNSFIKMYRNYGDVRFITGVLLALLLSWYIQTKGINKLIAADQPAGNKETK